MKKLIPELDYIKLDFGINKTDKISNPKFSISVPLKKDSSNISGTLSLSISESYIESSLFSVLVDTFTIFIITFLFLIEIVMFLILYLEKIIRNREHVKIMHKNTLNLRVLSFIIYTSSYMSVSFIPQVMKYLYVKPILNLSYSFILSLSVSISFLSGAIFTYYAGKYIDKFGYKKILIVGLSTLFISALASVFTKTVIVFIFTRAIFGIGYSITYLSMRSYAASISDEASKKQAFSSITSGLYAGVNTGAVVGAMLMDRIGYEKVFAISSVLVFISYLVVRSFFEGEEVASEETSPDTKNKFSITKIFKDINLFKFFLLISIPTALSTLFLDFFFPLYGSEVGISTPSIGRAYLVNGIFIAYISPFLSDYLSKFYSTKKMIALSIIFLSFSYLVFSIFWYLCINDCCSSPTWTW